MAGTPPAAPPRRQRRAPSSRSGAQSSRHRNLQTSIETPASPHGSRCFLRRHHRRWRASGTCFLPGLTAAVRPRPSRASTASAPAQHLLERVHLAARASKLAAGWADQADQRLHQPAAWGREAEAVYIRQIRSCAHGLHVSFWDANRKVLTLSLNSRERAPTFNQG